MDGIKVARIIQQKDLVLVDMMAIPNRTGIAAAIFEAPGSRGVSMRLIVQCIELRGRTHVALCVASKDLTTAFDVDEPIGATIGGEEVIHIPQVGR